MSLADNHSCFKPLVVAHDFFQNVVCLSLSHSPGEPGIASVY